jgi:transglutaminase-like putative cysteine protease
MEVAMSQTSADFEPRRYEVRHRTTYTYDGSVDTCYERGFLAPRLTPTQTVVSNSLVVDPEPNLVSEHVDHFGNQSFYLEIRTPHSQLSVTKTSIVDVAWPQPDLARMNGWTVASAADQIAAYADPVDRADYGLPSALVRPAPEVSEFAAGILRPDMPLGEAVSALTHGIFTDFAYEPGATTINTTLSDLLKLRAGVCQDFTHLAVGALRSIGIPARYVSGYLETAPPPGKPKLEGADASHAWASVMLPDGTWVDFDPTNDHFCDSRYVVTAWGRDFRDVSPLKGVIFADAASSSMAVAVDVTRLGA